jgi:hypothetical protein
MIKFNKKFVLFMALLAINFSCTSLQSRKKKSGKIQIDNSTCISDSTHAVEYAITKWKEKFNDIHFAEQPFTAKLIGDSVWFVSSSDEKIGKQKSGVINFGGVLTIYIRKSDCSVVSINVTK